jgi:CheY-like chemotaxis protein
LKHRPELIVLDLSMPVLNGLEASRELTRTMPTVPIILFSQYSDFGNGLIAVADELELAANYAARCYKTLIDSDFLKDARLETLLKQWPDIAKPYGFVCDCRLVTLAPHNN